MIQLSKQDLNSLNYTFKRSNKTIIKFLENNCSIDIKEGYTKGNYSIFKGNQIIDNKNCRVGIEVKNNLIINYEIFITE